MGASRLITSDLHGFVPDGDILAICGGGAGVFGAMTHTQR